MSRFKSLLSKSLNMGLMLVFALVLLLVFDETPAPAAESAQSLQLLSRSPQHPNLPASLLTPEEDAWLGQKKSLTLGISNPQYPPFDITNNRGEFEGITADYVGLIEEMLHIKVEVKIFASRRSALKALQNNEIDLLGSATQFDQHGADILLSEPYASEQSVLVTQANEKRAMGHYLAGRTLTMAEGFLPADWVRAQYPQAKLRIYPTYQEAVGAVAFGKADVYLGDLYPISKNFLNNMRVLKFADFPPKTFSFATSKGDQFLLDIINKTLSAVSTEEQLSILQRWHIGRSSMLLSQDVFQLSDTEKAWIERHPMVRVAVINGYAPMTFVDDDGNYRGITIDVLSQIRLRTGLNFEIREASSVAQLKQMLNDREADMIGALTPSADRKQNLLFTRPYMTNAFVMVVRQLSNNNNGPSNLQEMQGKRLAVIEGTGMIEKIREQYPQIQLVMAENATEVLAILHKGQADAALNTLVNSEYQIARYYRNSLRITSTVGTAPAYISFAVPDTDPELLSILDKVMLSIPPDELDVIGNLWRPNNMVAADNFWRENRTTIFTGIAFTLALLLVSFFWASWLRRQVTLKERAQAALNEQLQLRKKLLEELNLAKEQAEDANRAKTSFLSTMSHEIRTPLNAVIGMLEMSIKAAEQGEVDQQALEVAFGSANGLVELVGDILDIARIESGKLELNLEVANVRAITESVIRVFNGLAVQKGLALTLTLGDDCDAEVKIDPLRYKQILSNLIGNAIKFTHTGIVAVSVSVRNVDDGALREIIAEVRDSGIGIAADDLQKLFAPFSQVGDYGQQVRQGTGLGLVISKTLCEKMGGSIHIDSQPGLGTRIEARVQVEWLRSHAGEPQAVNVVPARALPASTTSLRMLVIDDYRANRLLLIKQLEYLGHQVSEAEDGIEGLEVWRQGPRFDVVITDCNMPGMNGYQLARAVREAERQKNAVPCQILGFTANAQAEETARCLAAGMDGCLFKPSTLNDLADWLQVVAPSSEHAEPRPARTPEALLTSMASLTGGNSRLAKQLALELQRSNDEDGQLLRQALHEQDAGALAELAHKIIGGARIVGVGELVQACETLESICRADAVDRQQVQQAGEVLIQQLEVFGKLLAATLKILD